MIAEIIITIVFSILSFFAGVRYERKKYNAQIKRDFTDIYLTFLEEKSGLDKKIKLKFCEETEELFLLIRLNANNQSQKDGKIHNPKVHYSNYSSTPLTFSEINTLPNETKDFALDFFKNVEYFEKDFAVPKEESCNIGLMFRLDTYLSFLFFDPTPMKISYVQYKDKTVIRELPFGVALINFSNKIDFEIYRKFKNKQKKEDEKLAEYCEKKAENLFR